jgi:hypothetical protein
MISIFLIMAEKEVTHDDNGAFAINLRKQTRGKT